MRIRFLLAPALALLPVQVQAHAGHIADLGGHDHWVLGVGLGVIAGAAVLGWLKGDREVPEDEAEEDTDETPEEQPA